MCDSDFLNLILQVTITLFFFFRSLKLELELEELLFCQTFPNS